MTLATADHWADIMRWWAFIGAPIGGFPLAARLWAIVKVRAYGGRAEVPVPQLGLILAGSSLLCFLFFSFVAGALLPLTSRIAGFGLNALTVRYTLAGIWTVAGVGSWLAAAALHRGRWYIVGAAFSWFVAVCFATIATAGG